MYDELVKDLREKAEFLSSAEPLNIKNAFAETMKQASDAIEELQQTAEHYKGCADDWYKEACDYKAMLPRWIPVTERLPESGETVLAYCRVKLKNGNGRGYVCNAFYSAPKTEQRSTEYDDIDLEYDEETDEYYLPEGWWEQIYNWEEYGFVAIADFVTHWMPLPEPPQEEA